MIATMGAINAASSDLIQQLERYRKKIK